VPRGRLGGVRGVIAKERRSDVIPIATKNKILDTLRNHLELENVEALSWKLDHSSKIKNSPKQVPNPKLIWMNQILSN